MAVLLLVCRMLDHRGMLDDLASLLRALPSSRAARQETRRMEQQAGLGGVALVRMTRDTSHVNMQNNLSCADALQRSFTDIASLRSDMS